MTVHCTMTGCDLSCFFRRLSLPTNNHLPPVRGSFRLALDISNPGCSKTLSMEQPGRIKSRYTTLYSTYTLVVLRSSTTYIWIWYRWLPWYKYEPPVKLQDIVTALCLVCYSVYITRDLLQVIHLALTNSHNHLVTLSMDRGVHRALSELSPDPVQRSGGRRW